MALGMCGCIHQALRSKRFKEAEPVAKVLVEQVFCRFGSPVSSLTDQGHEPAARDSQSLRTAEIRIRSPLISENYLRFVSQNTRRRIEPDAKFGEIGKELWT